MAKFMTMQEMMNEVANNENIELMGYLRVTGLAFVADREDGDDDILAAITLTSVCEDSDAEVERFGIKITGSELEKMVLAGATSQDSMMSTLRDIIERLKATEKESK